MKRRLRSGRVVLLLAVAAAVSAIAPAAAQAEAEVVVASSTPEVTQEADGSQKVELKFTNASSRPVTLFSVVVGEGCEVTPAKAALPPEKIEPVTLTIPADCGPTSELTIEMTPDPATGQVTPFVIHPTTAAHTETDWSNLWAIPIAFVGAIVFLFAELSYLVGGSTAVAGGLKSLPKPMENLSASWKFDDNWVTNVTAVGALFTTIFTAANGKAFLGQESEASFALATVGALAAGTFAAAAPVVLAATKKVRESGGAPRKESVFTVGGVTLAAALVLASAYGQLWVVLKTAETLELGGLAHNLKYPFAVAGLLLLVYAWRSYRETIERGLQSSHARTHATRKPAMVSNGPFAAAGGEEAIEPESLGEVELVEHWPAPSALL